MDSTDVSNIKELLPLADKYGLAYIVALILLFIVIYFLKAISKGELVPRELLDRAEEDRDRLQAILDRERADFMAPTLEVLQRLKIDHNAAGGGNDQDRGG